MAADDKKPSGRRLLSARNNSKRILLPTDTREPAIGEGRKRGTLPSLKRPSKRRKRTRKMERMMINKLVLDFSYL